MPQNWVGKKIGDRYQIETMLGQGGMSAVYKAIDPNLRRPVAIKMIHAHLSDDPKFIGRFKEEAAAVARLRHPNIVQVHDFNVDGETYYMVMEYLIGETLQARLKRVNAAGRHIPLDEVVKLCIQLCDAAGYAHDHELVHRDIKPANIMLNINNQAILMDFGIVKIIGGDYHTATGATIGTAMYMAPEQIRSERIDERADIYSLGVTLYEMLSGQPPYMADSALTLMMMVLNDPLPDLSETRKGIPESLVKVVQKALAKNPAERFQTMAEMAAELRKVQAALTSASPEVVSTRLDKTEIESASPAIEADRPTEVEIPGTSQIGSSEVIPSPAEHRESAKNVVSTETAQDGARLRTVPETAKRSAPAASLPSRLNSRRILLAAASLLVLVVAVSLGLLYMNAKKPPDLKLMPISLPPEPINAVTAPAVVNLGRWETGSPIENIAFSTDGNLIATANNRDASSFSPYRNYIGLWQVQTGSLQNYFLGHSQWVYDVAFTPNSQAVGSVADDGSSLLWRIDDASLLQRFDSTHGGLTSLAFSTNQLLLAAGSWDGIVNLWQVSNGNLLRTLQQDELAIKDVHFSPDGTLLAAASDNNAILIWQVSDGKLVHTLQAHTAPVYKVNFSSNGLLLASASEDRTIKIWRVNDGVLLQNLSGHSDVVYDVAFSPDVSLLASGSGDGTLRLWQVSTGTLLSMLGENSDSIKGVAFAPDGHLLVSGTVDGVIQFWGISEAIPLNNK